MTTASAVATPSRAAAFRNMSGAGLPAMCSAAATMPSVTTSKRGASPDASSTSPALRDDDTTATFVPIVARWSRNRSEPG